MLGSEGWRIIRNLFDKGLSVSEVAGQLGIYRKAVRRYANSDELPAPKQRTARKSKLGPYRDRIGDLIGKYNLSSVRILEEIRKQGYDGGYTILKKYCATLRKDRRVQAVYRYETDPGKQSQADFGEFGHIEIDGKRRKLYAFSMILGYSKMRCAEFTPDIYTENVIRMHLNSFRYLEGYTDTILYDNMKQVVLERKLKASESVFNRKFSDFSE